MAGSRLLHRRGLGDRARRDFAGLVDDVMAQICAMAACYPGEIVIGEDLMSYDLPMPLGTGRAQLGPAMLKPWRGMCWPMWILRYRRDRRIKEPTARAGRVR